MFLRIFQQKLSKVESGFQLSLDRIPVQYLFYLPTFGMVVLENFPVPI